MDCATAKSLLSNHFDNELPLVQRAEVDAHLHQCPDCRAEWTRFGELGDMLRCPQSVLLPSELWPRIERKLDASSLLNRDRLAGNRILSTALAVAAVLILGLGWTYWQMNRTSSKQGATGDALARDHSMAHAHSAMAADMQALIANFVNHPVGAIESLSQKYAGQMLPIEETAALLGYVPTAGSAMPSGYRLASMHVLKMPCCVCSATLCRRTDGSPIVVFEHKEQQPSWFGKTQSIMARCFDKQCQVVEMAKHLAATWRHGDRHLTIIGAEGLDEVTRWVEALSTSKEPAERPKNI